MKLTCKLCRNDNWCNPKYLIRLIVLYIKCIMTCVIISWLNLVWSLTAIRVLLSIHLEIEIWSVGIGDQPAGLVKVSGLQELQD